MSKPKAPTKPITPIFNEINTKLWWNYRIWTQTELDNVSNFLTTNSKDFILTTDFYENMKYLFKSMGLHYHPFLNYPIRKTISQVQSPVGTQLLGQIDTIKEKDLRDSKKPGTIINDPKANQPQSIINQPPVAITNDQELEILMIKNTQVDSCTLKLLQFCWGLSKLSVLKFTNNNLDPDSEKLLYEILSHAAFKCQKVFYDWNSIKNPDHAVKIFNNPSIEYLTLRVCDIDDNKLKILCEGLKLNTTLKFIDLYGNKITKEGMGHLEKVIDNTGSTLEYISVAKNNIHEWNDLADFFSKIGRIPITPEEAEIHKQKEKDKEAIIQKNLKNKGNKKYIDEPVPQLDPLAQLPDGTWVLLKNIKLKVINLSLNSLESTCLEYFEKVLKSTDDAFQLILQENKFDEVNKERFRIKFGQRVVIQTTFICGYAYFPVMDLILTFEIYSYYVDLCHAIVLDIDNDLNIMNN